MVDVTEAVCPENKTAFEYIRISRKETVRHVEEMKSDLLTQLNDTVQAFAYFLVTLDDSDTTQLLMFIRGVNDKFHVIKSSLSYCPWKQ
jgi:hypothetical protein